MDYTNTVFYKIVCKDVRINECYVGHTTNFKGRKNHHKHACNNMANSNYGFRLYEYIRKHGGWDNWDMIMIETCACANFLEASQQERGHLEHLGATLNTKVPSRSFTEYLADNKEQLDKVRQEYRDTHKEQIKTYGETYRELHKEEKQEYGAKYRETHKDEKSVYAAKYRETHKEQMRLHYNASCTCECGCQYTHANKQRHFKSTKHKQLMEQLNSTMR
jgi:hypothetical protein